MNGFAYCSSIFLATFAKSYGLGLLNSLRWHKSCPLRSRFKKYHYMKGAIYFFIVLSLFEIKAVAQVFNTSLGFGYDAMVEGEGFPVMSVGVEGAGNGRWSVSGGFNFGSTSNSNIGPVLVDRTHYAFEGNANFYFRRTLPGFFLSGGGFFGVNKTDPIDGGQLTRPDAAMKVEVFNSDWDSLSNLPQS
jgi:hypothetical protein